jgi:hypothetical protein
MPFDATAQSPWAVPFALEDYLELLDWTGRAIRSDKSGHIPPGHPKILDRLGIEAERFIGYSERLLKELGAAVGAPAAMISLCARRQTRYLHGIRAARCAFRTNATERHGFPRTRVTGQAPNASRGERVAAARRRVCGRSGSDRA